LNRLVLETDAPYLSPVPYRGKRNESSYIPIIAQRIAEIKKTPVEEVASVTTANANLIFNA
jgi:TatD DNase family protein